MTKDRPRNRPGSGSGRGPGGGGFRPGKGPFKGPRKPVAGAAGRGAQGPENASETSSSDKPWENRGPARAAGRSEGRPEARADRPDRGPKPFGKPRGGPGGKGASKPAWGQGGPRKGASAESRRDRPAKAPRNPDRPGGAQSYGGSALREGRHRDRPRESYPVESADTDDLIEFGEADDFEGDIDDVAAESGRPAGRGPQPRTNRARHTRPYDRREAAFEENGDVWIWGMHACAAVLANPKRRIREAVLTRNAAQRLGLDPEAPPAYAKLLEPREIDHRLPEGAVHQGAGLRCAPLDPLEISDVAAQPDKPLVILDQVQDPQNVGAVFRSAAAFGFGGVVMQTRRAPALGGALAKAAAGAIELVPEVRAVNLARAVDALVDAGWTVIALAGEAQATLAEAFTGPGPFAVVLGAEGPGVRPAVANACSSLARIPMAAGMESLNVSNAAAIAFYEASARRS